MVIISDPNFREVTSASKLPGTINLSDQWTLVLKQRDSATDGDVRRAPLGGITIRWEGSPKLICLWQEFEISAAEAGSELDCEVTLQVQAEAAHPRIVEWIAIVDAADPGRIIHKLCLKVGDPGVDGVWTIVARAAAVRLARKKYRLCVQFEDSPKELTLRSVRGELYRREAAADAAGTNEEVTSHEAVQSVPSPATRGLVPARGDGMPAARRGSALHEKTRNIRLQYPPRSLSRADTNVTAVNATPGEGLHALVQRPESAGEDSRPKVVVIAWDMAHNAVGRAHLLADMLSRDYAVTVIGPIFVRFGSAVWGPLRSSSIEYRAFRAEALQDFTQSAKKFVDSIAADVVIACKPRLPSLLLALLLKQRLGCPTLLDVDDHELSFFGDAAPLSVSDARTAFEAEPDAAEQPHGKLWTRLAGSLIGSFDATIVSNVALQLRFNGTIVRHARDERLFGADAESRSRIRAEFGYSDEDKIVLFLGTPREHKGIFRIADALRRIQNEKLALCIIGDVTAKRVRARLGYYADVRIDLFPDQPWERLPELIRLADCVCLLQDEDSPIAQYQAPAKLTEALAVGVPVAVTAVPPFADIPPGIVTVVRTDADLDFFLTDVAQGNAAGDALKRRVDYFIQEFSYEVNRARLALLISRAREKWPAWQQESSDFLELVAELSGTTLPRTKLSRETQTAREE